MILYMVIVWVHKLALPENAGSEFITLFHVISLATHFIALIWPLHQDCCAMLRV